MAPKGPRHDQSGPKVCASLQGIGPLPLAAPTGSVICNSPLPCRNLREAASPREDCKPGDLYGARTPAACPVSEIRRNAAKATTRGTLPCASRPRHRWLMGSLHRPVTCPLIAPDGRTSPSPATRNPEPRGWFRFLPEIPRVPAHIKRTTHEGGANFVARLPPVLTGVSSPRKLCGDGRTTVTSCTMFRCSSVFTVLCRDHVIVVALARTMCAPPLCSPAPIKKHRITNVS